MIYKPHYLNVARRHTRAIGSNRPYFDRVVCLPLGWRKKPPEVIPYKSKRRYARKVRWSEISHRLG